MNTFGKNFRVTIFGESHGRAVGAVVDGVPAGFKIDFAQLGRELLRRAPGKDEYSTQRKEADVPEILSGIKDGVATGTPIACFIRNNDIRPDDYPAAFRPGHADLTAFLKYKGFADRSGGGAFSGRLTAGLVFAGAIAKQILAGKGINIYGRVQRLGGVSDDMDFAADGVNESVKATLAGISNKEFPCADAVEQEYKHTILAAKVEKDSVGGVVEAVCFGAPAGVGEPFFTSIESHISQILFSVPAVKGVEFGAGFAIADMLGSESNDAIVLKDGVPATETNNNGGILGGIANGEPIIVRAAIKPTASIGISQKTIDAEAQTETTLELGGRHDPCIAPRAVVVVEAAIAIALLDLVYSKNE